nr:hypothetical protein GCM10020093_060340 [Planobispora longispora]
MILSAVLAGCGAAETPAPRSAPAAPVKLQAASVREGFTSMDGLVEAARREGSLTVIALARDWVNYGEIIDAFSDEYGIKVTELEPGASSARQIEAAAQLKPDVFDLSLEVAVANADAFAPYRVHGWQDIPDDLKDTGGAGTPPTAGTCPSATTHAGSRPRPPTPTCSSPATASGCRATRGGTRPPSAA